MADVDDGSIADDAKLFRRIHPRLVVDDKNRSEKRPSSGAFDDSELSVDAEPLLANAGLDWHFSLKGYEGYSLVSFIASAARGLSLPVLHKPLPDNPAHCEIHGKKTTSLARALARASVWVHLEPSPK